MVPKKFSVSVLIRENNLGFITNTQYLPDVVPSVQMIVVEFYEYNTVNIYFYLVLYSLPLPLIYILQLCYVKSDHKNIIISNCVGDADGITLNLFPLVNPTTLAGHILIFIVPLYSFHY